MTEPEIIIWSLRRKKQFDGFQWYRQRIIGDYIVDFYCPSRKLVIEIDGGQHITPEGQLTDTKRDSYLKSLDIRVIHFLKSDIMNNIEGVFERLTSN